MNKNSNDRMTLKEVASLCAVGTTTIYAWMKNDATFPRPIRWGRKNMWMHCHVSAWIEARQNVVSRQNHERLALIGGAE